MFYFLLYLFIDIMPAELPGRSGAIQAALNLEIGTDRVSRLDIRIEGLNGQLPNLDFVNTAVRLCRREGITPTLQKRVSTK
jgi:GPI-anchor transamidase subunit GAA1